MENDFYHLKIGQTATYTSFVKVDTLTEGTYTATFVYNSDNQRAKMDVAQSGVNIFTRWYAGSRYMKETAGVVTKEITWIGGDAYTAPVAAETAFGTTTYYYLLRDYLGNITHQVNTSNTVVAEFSFDAWGRRRSADDWNYTLDANDLALFAGRGFTGHEHLTVFNLINMNGRLYDPLVGRFLSPDNYVQAVGYTQSFNRYSYALNNPLIYFDPTGEKWKWPKFAWFHAIPVFGQLDYLFQMINDNTEKARQKMVDVGVPPFGVGVSVNGAGNVNVSGSYKGQEVFNTGNIDRSNAEQVVNKEIAQVRQDYGDEWHAASTGISYFNNALKFEGTPYLFGGMTDKGIDCSGLINRATGNETRVWSTSDGVPPGNWNKVNARTDSYGNFKADLMRGDLLLWKGHAAFYGGGNDLFHAQRTGTNVGYTHDLYWWLKNKGYPNAYREY